MLRGGNNPNNDLAIQGSPDDTVSSLRWAPQSNHLMASSWDNTVRFWEVTASGQAEPKGVTTLETPALDAQWTDDGARVLLGEANGKLMVWDLQSNSVQQIGQHSAPIKSVRWVDLHQAMCSAGWDKEVAYWDGNSNQPVVHVTCPERIYSMDARGNLLVTAMADRSYCIFDIRKPDTVFRHAQPSLKHQLRVIACFPDERGFILASIAGRAAVQFIEPPTPKSNFTFKCHRQEQQQSYGQKKSVAYPVHDIAFHMLGSFATVGGDGAYSFWDKDNRQRLLLSKPLPLPITAGAFNKGGEIFAYASGYDWHQGVDGYPNPNNVQVYLKEVQGKEVIPKKNIK